MTIPFFTVCIASILFGCCNILTFSSSGMFSVVGGEGAIITGSVVSANVVAANTASLNFFNIGAAIADNAEFTASIAIL